ncbi:amidohydrolase family protein [Alphaproteobacteria bacterium KMM 3653]|uniref:Amidohydrolase family protein n=1 Tax=Harenicola maris TaxID=2841044 RepID=A0AAP2CRW4_9RHOB|nr:amidohydrolase family protein [Harenicola maris]
MILGRVLRGAVWAAVFGGLAGGALAHDDPRPPIGDAVAELPLFDAHIHYKEPAWEAYSPADIIGLMDQSGVAMGLVSSTPDEGTIRLFEYAPKRVVPELRPYHADFGSSNWHEFEGMTAYLEKRLNAHPHQGIGEFHIRNRRMFDKEMFREIVAMARARDIYLHVHSGAAPVEWLYDLDPEVKIIWAHAGLGEPAAKVYRVMKRNPNLLADTSLREGAILGSDGELDETWAKIIFEFQDRLMVGSDTWVNSQWDRYGPIMDQNRLWLSKLPREVAEKIAYRNAERVFGRKVTMDLIGER